MPPAHRAAPKMAPSKTAPPMTAPLKLAHRQESFGTVMRNNAMEFDEADEINPKLKGLDFAAFCVMVRERELGEHELDELRSRFMALDINGSGRIEKDEYLRASLRDALARSHARVAQILESWDEDGNGEVDKAEFKRAVRSMGFGDLSDRVIDLVFLEFDEDRSGSVSCFEIDRRLKKYAKLIPEQQYALRRTAGGRRGAALAPSVKLDRSSGRPVSELLRDALAQNAVRVIDLFRDWDENGDGLISQKEFYQAMAPLGLDVSRDEAMELFDQFDPDGSGTIEFKELNQMLRRRVDLKTLARAASTEQAVEPHPMSKSMKLTLAAMTALEQSGSLPAGAAAQMQSILQLRSQGDARIRRSHSSDSAMLSGSGSGGGGLALLAAAEASRQTAAGSSSDAAASSSTSKEASKFGGVVRPAPRLAFTTSKPQMLDDLAQLWMHSRPNAAQQWRRTNPQVKNLLPPRTAQQLKPHRHAPTVQVSSTTMARLHAVQGSLRPSTAPAVAFSVNARVETQADVTLQHAPAPAPRRAPPRRPGSGGSRRPESILTQLSPRP